MARVRIAGTPSAQQDHLIMKLARDHVLTLTVQDGVLTLGGCFTDEVWIAMLGLQRSGLRVDPVNEYTIPLSLKGWNLFEILDRLPEDAFVDSIQTRWPLSVRQEGGMGML